MLWKGPRKRRPRSGVVRVDFAGCSARPPIQPARATRINAPLPSASTQTKPRTDVEIRLANSVAVATNAAAAAAEAAARAAVACAVQKSPRASLALPAPGAPPAEGGPLGD